MISEKQSLQKYVEDIAKTIFLNSTVNIEVYAIADSVTEFICEIELPDVKIKKEQMIELSEFIQKEINYSDSNFNKIYWIEDNIKSKNLDKTLLHSKKLNSRVTLPSFVDDYIFNDLNAKYSPDFVKFCRNLEHRRDDVLTYLGTYFPRSYAETNSISNNLLQNSIINNSLNEKNEINILDVGAGTGGNLLGLLFSLLNNLKSNKRYNITAIDGNKDALIILEKIIMQLQVKYNISICLSCYYVTFENIKDLYNKTKTNIETEFEFILSSKMINEIINESNNSYLDFYYQYSRHLVPDGLLLMLDVTTKIEDLDYIPILLNQQTNLFIHNNLDIYKNLIPNICSENDTTCSNNCFSNNVFTINHSKKSNDISSVTYRIVGHKKYIESIKEVSHQIGGIIGWNKNQKPNRYCPYASISNRDFDSYRV